MWMNKKKDKEKEEGPKKKDSNEAADDEETPGGARARRLSARRGSGDKEPTSPVSASTPSRPRRMSFDAAANADMVKSALGDVNSIIMQAAQQQKDAAASAKTNGRRGSFTAATPVK